MLLEKDFQQILPNNVGARRKMISRQKMLLQIQDSTAKPSTKASTSNVSGMSLMDKNSLDGMPAGHCGALYWSRMQVNMPLSAVILRILSAQ